ncbi:hypothetical protein LZ32DRAFT_101791 [Colletotrichum eremochloae]|nr:hypothetical protein LZ32DRAFT_101791 [Colletotrichum eremochloae]
MSLAVSLYLRLFFWVAGEGGVLGPLCPSEPKASYYLLSASRVLRRALCRGRNPMHVRPCPAISGRWMRIGTSHYSVAYSAMPSPSLVRILVRRRTVRISQTHGAQSRV